MKTLTDRKQELLSIKAELVTELDSISEKVGQSFTDNKLNTDDLAIKHSTIESKLLQLEKEINSTDQAIKTREIELAEAEKAKIWNAQYKKLESACAGIAKAWELQDKLSSVLQGVIADTDNAVIDNSEIELQTRAIIGGLMSDCRLFNVSAAGTAAIKRNEFDQSEVNRLASKLRSA